MKFKSGFLLGPFFAILKGLRVLSLFLFLNSLKSVYTMKKMHFFSALALCAVLITGLSLSAQAQTSRFYLAGYLGLNVFAEQEFKDTATGSSGNFDFSNAESFAGALGFRLSQQVRLEGEFSYRKADISDADVSGVGTISVGDNLKTKILSANAYYDFDVPWSIQPYVGGGLGYGWHEGQVSSSLISSTSSEDSRFIWNIAAGAKFRYNPDLAFTAGYRYLDTFSDIEIGPHEIGYDSHEFRVGMEWDLPIN